jgi:hypothetical protein
MERTLSFKTTGEVAEWVDAHPGGRSAFLRELVERARQAEIDARDLAIIEAHGGNLSDSDPVVDPDEWEAAAAEWDEVDL